MIGDVEYPYSYIGNTLDDATRMNSSSGGIFTEVAKTILQNNGIIIGAAFDENNDVVHITIDSVEDIKKLQGSKYLQSKMGNILSRTKTYLDEGRTVLFSGTPCQIAGLKTFLQKDYSTLFTIDVLCHGVPSEKVWGKYLNEQEALMGSTIDFINFRDKEKYGWKSYAMTLKAGKIKYTKTHADDVFMQFFLKNIDLRPSCHECRFKDIHHKADITLGDYWSIRRYNAQMDDDKGTSVIVVHTAKGEELIQRIMNECKLVRVDIDKVLPPTAESRKSVSAHHGRERFFELLNSGESLKKLQKMVDDPVLVKAKRNLARIKRKVLG